ncbi:hypothetical protein BamIOP4010DRAFT_1873 [Burkholderia ambifaria IOP40-10]|jgi:hypothetical protein|uniref:Uncharacterized protein n=1 Tax=Burkholderia ambifaria IOP40-10 TaxID=396596 RepID=B1FCW4_9BURK|nr:hypothetical protein BamIOP4010DRAFT_1873 [Burkholderia ambifaria IOP40-10]
MMRLSGESGRNTNTRYVVRTAALLFKINAAIFNRFGYMENADLF